MRDWDFVFDPRRDIRSIALEGLARIDTILMREFLAPVGVRPDVEDCAWIRNAPVGPSAAGIAEVERAVAEHGEENVTTGDARPCHPKQVGIYVRRAA